MKLILWRRIIITVLAIPIAALADLNQTTTLEANTTLNLRTGATAAAGGDLLWNGNSITPQGNARAYNFGPFGADTFDGLVEGQVRPLLFIASTAPIPGATLVVDDIFVVATNGGNAAKVLVTAKSGTSITLRFTTFIAVVPVGPAITAIVNNSSGIPPGLPNYGIAPSTLFLVYGSGLADPAGVPGLQPTEPPGLPLKLNGAELTVVVNGVTTHPALYYTSPGQLAAVLPAATPVGTGTLTVTYDGVTSPPAVIVVVPSALGFNVYNGHLGVATDPFTGALLTFTASGSPGQIIVLWATGLGADPADSDSIFSTSPNSVPTPLEIYIGGVLATILYQGSSGYPGVNQINVIIPLSVPTGCRVPLAAITSGPGGSVASNVVTIPINDGGGTCRDALTGTSGDHILQADLRAGLVSLVKTDRPGNNGARIVDEAANGAFGRYSGLAAAATGEVPSPGGCVVFPIVVGGPVGFTGLDAGTITLSGPAGLDVTLGSQFGLKGTYTALLADGAIPLTGGIFTFHGSGGMDVGSFTSTIEFANPLMTWTNQEAAAVINKNEGLNVTWNGGNPATYIAISGTSVTGGSEDDFGVAAGFICLAPVGAGQFTVPPYVLLGMPSGKGGVAVQNYVYSALSATGLDLGSALGDISYDVESEYH